MDNTIEQESSSFKYKLVVEYENCVHYEGVKKER